MQFVPKNCFKLLLGKLKLFFACESSWRRSCPSAVLQGCFSQERAYWHDFKQLYQSMTPFQIELFEPHLETKRNSQPFWILSIERLPSQAICGYATHPLLEFVNPLSKCLVPGKRSIPLTLMNTLDPWCRHSRHFCPAHFMTASRSNFTSKLESSSFSSTGIQPR